MQSTLTNPALLPMQGPLSGCASVPLWKKYALNITEASDYFGIGEKKLRGVIERNLDTGFVLQNGVKYLIKRKQFEDFLDHTNSL